MIFLQNDTIIEVKNLKKVFSKPVREPGLLGMFKSLFTNKKIETVAVNDVNFTIKEGEMVAYIGANGAGKSTTIKMMTGILTPTKGEVLILNEKPYDSKKRKDVLKHIGVVFGQRTQLWWDLPLIETFNLLKDVYDVSDEDFKERFNYLKTTLELEKFLNSPVRTLSLGQRMRADLAASLLHNPKVLFLDEPTIGLDVLVKEHIITAIKEINQKYHTTVILTTHDMNDIVTLCNRVIIIDEGKILFDGALDEVKNRFGDNRTITMKAQSFDIKNFLKKYNVTADYTNGIVTITFDALKYNSQELLNYAFSLGEIKDIAIRENDISEVVKKIYEKKSF